MTGNKFQMALDLSFRAASGRDDFFISGSNAEAAAWVDKWPDWPGAALVLTGPEGCGKTHLGKVWQARSNALSYGGGVSLDVTNPPPNSAILIEDVDRTGDDASLFHLFNAVTAAGGSMLFTARTPPARWAERLPDLVSRLSAAPTVSVRAPDEVLVTAVLIKMFADQKLNVDPDVLNYLVVRMERSFADARAIVADINHASLAERRPVTIPLVREALQRRQERQS